MDPNTLVAAYGETVTHSYISVAAFDVDDVLNLTASTIASNPITAIASMPSEKEVVQFHGLATLPTLKITVLSTVDIQPTRNGRQDRVTRGGVKYEVVEVRPDRHPFVGAEKKTVFLAPDPGR